MSLKPNQDHLTSAVVHLSDMRGIEPLMFTSGENDENRMQEYSV